MAKLSKEVINWLYSVLQPQYLHKEAAYTDIYRFLAAYLPQSFKIRTAVFTSPSGAASLLINLHGTLACEQGSVPLQIWIPLNYPFADDHIPQTEPNGVPMVYVVPPLELAIRPGNNVDTQGRFYHPFLLLWHRDFAPGRQLPATYDLLLLMTCLKSTFDTTYPLRRPPVTTGPALPEKPLLMPPQLTGTPPAQPNGPPPLPAQLTGSFAQPISAQLTGQPRRDTSGPPLPEKPGSNSVPLRYRGPPPLPSQTQSIYQSPPLGSPERGSPQIRNLQLHGTPQHLSNDEGARSPMHPKLGIPLSTSRGHSHTNSYATPYGSPPVQAPERIQSRLNEAKGVPEIEDLMDKVTLDGPQEVNRSVLEKVSQQINAFLAPENPDSANHHVSFVNENTAKINALHSQLSHHVTQAKANSENLQNHITYLNGQVEAIRSLNSNLVKLEEKNAQSTSEVHMNNETGHRILLDEIVTPDLALVNQLYETSAEIKAYKDAIRLVGGSYKSEREIINDDNLEACTKAVRSLAREAFWLEAMRNEIGKTMGLHQ